MDRYDVIVIGGGTAGLKAALRLAAAGKTTCLFEPGALGGTCLNVGCIPTKALLHASHVYRQSVRAGSLGVRGTMKVDFPALMKRVRGIVREGHDHINVKKEGLTFMAKAARFLSPKVVQAGTRLYTAKRFIVAVGASNFVPPIPGLEDVPTITNENILSMKKLPRRVHLIGGGYISLEFATFFSDLGCSVTVSEVAPRILGMIDEDLTDELVSEYKKRGVTFYTRVEQTTVKKSGTSIAITVEADGQKTQVRCDAVVTAVGRIPATKGLDLDKAHVEAGPHGGIVVDETMRTSNRRVYALGDCTGREMFAHTAKREVDIVVDQIAGRGRLRRPDGRTPWTVFTSPPIAGVGLSEQEAEKQGVNVEVVKAPFRNVGRAAIIGSRDGFAKAVVHAKTKRLLGGFLIGPGADDLIHEFSLAMTQKKPTLDLIRQAIHVHPTLSEVFGGM